MNPPNMPENMSAEGKAQYAIFLDCIAAERAGTATLEQRRFVCRVLNAAVASLGGTWAAITNEDYAEGQAALEWEAAELRRMCADTPTHAVHTTMPQSRVGRGVGVLPGLSGRGRGEQRLEPSQRPATRVRWLPGSPLAGRAHGAPRGLLRGLRGFSVALRVPHRPSVDVPQINRIFLGIAGART